MRAVTSNDDVRFGAWLQVILRYYIAILKTARHLKSIPTSINIEYSENALRVDVTEG